MTGEVPKRYVHCFGLCVNVVSAHDYVQQVVIDDKIGSTHTRIIHLTCITRVMGFLGLCEVYNDVGLNHDQVLARMCSVGSVDGVVPRISGRYSDSLG